MTDQISIKSADLKAQLKNAWGKLTDDEIGNYEGKRDLFFSSVKDKHGTSKEDAEKQIAAFTKPETKAAATTAA